MKGFAVSPDGAGDCGGPLDEVLLVGVEGIFCPPLPKAVSSSESDPVVVFFAF